MKTRLLQILTILLLCGHGVGVAADGRSEGASAEALRVARESLPQWSLGRLKIEPKTGKPAKVKAELLYRGRVVGKLRVDPRTGGFIDKDRDKARRAEGSADMPDLPSLRAAVAGSIRHLEIGGWAWPKKRGRVWGVPLRYQGRVVGKIEVDVEKGPIPEDDDDDDDD